MTVFSIETLSSKQFSELNRRLEPNLLGASGSNIAADDAEPKWNVSIVAEGRTHIAQALNAISQTMAQAVTVPYYTINELPEDVQRHIIDKVLEDNVYEAMFATDRAKSFTAICAAFCFSWGESLDGSIWVEPNGDTELQGAKRVIAYINNHWDFKTAAYTSNSKLRALRKQWTLAKSHMEDNLPTGYCADYCCKDAYKAFVAQARETPDKVTLEDFCNALAIQFDAEVDSDYEQATSDEYVKECLLADHYYTWYGEDITALVKRK